MGNSPTACTGCCSDLSRRMPLAQTVYEANFGPENLIDGDVVPVAAALSKVCAKEDPYQPGGTVALAGSTSSETVAALHTDHRIDCTAQEDSSDDSRDDCSAAASDSTAESATPADVGQAQEVVKKFVRSFIKGRAMSVLTVSGSTAECVASLDRKLTTFSLQRSGKKDAKKRGITLRDISEVCIGEHAGEEVDLPLDDLCVTLLLEDGNAIAFRFADEEERDTFALCLSMFIDGQKGQAERKKK